MLCLYRARLLGLSAACSVALTSHFAAAQAASPTSPPASAPASTSAPAPAPAPTPATTNTTDTQTTSTEELLAQAAAHWKKGRELADKKAWDGALAEYLESRRIYPNTGATSSAAECLYFLERYDEALDMLEILFRDFAKNLSARQKLEAQNRMIELRGLVGTIDVVGTEAGATISIDQQSRGEVPMLAPVRVVVGSHNVRVYKEGFEPFETRVNVAGGQSASVKADLPRLLRSGRLHVAEPSGLTLDVIVDGGVVGTTPFEGPLAPGEHIVSLRGEGERGAPPTPITIEQNRTTSLVLPAERLGASVRVRPLPANASVAIDSVLLGRGVWQGRLRAGKHRLEVAAEGFVPIARDILLEDDRVTTIPAPLERDPKSPFWRIPPRPSHITFEMEGDFLVGPSFANVSSGCAGGCYEGPSIAGLVAARLGYELGSRVGFGVMAGYLGASQSTFSQTSVMTVVGEQAPHRGKVDDALAIHGFLATGWASVSFFDSFPLHIRLGAGVLFGGVSDERSGTFSSRSADSYAIGPVIEAHNATYLTLLPEIRVGLPLGRGFEINAGLELPILLTLSAAKWDATHGIYAGTAGYGAFAPAELTDSTIILVAPSVGVRYDL